VDAIAALAVALGAFDAEHVELAFYVAEDEIGSGHGVASLLRRERYQDLPGTTSVKLPIAGGYNDHV
jgi:hypothetical protein